MTILDNTQISEKCTACGACVNICPKKAIVLSDKKNNFLFPEVDGNKCVQCGLCNRVCHIGKELKNTQIDGYGSFRGEDSLRLKSSSGALFYYLAQTVLKSGGAVYGAAFDPVNKTVKHVSTDEYPLEDVMRSKYVQSETGDCYRKVVNDLAHGRKVLFCGTPCQNYALTQILNGKNYDNLLKVDFVCHGVPSGRFFKDVLTHYENVYKSKVNNVTFREKDIGWRSQVVKIYFDNGCVLSERSNYYYYYYLAFINNLTLRDSCFKCRFPTSHYSDLTIFDYWESADNDNLGTSGYLVNSPNGQKYINLLPESLFGKIDKEDYIKLVTLPHDCVDSYNHRYRYAVKFRRIYKKYGVKRAIKYLKTVTKRIRISERIKSKFKSLRMKCKQVFVKNSKERI